MAAVQSPRNISLYKDGGTEGRSSAARYRHRAQGSKGGSKQPNPNQIPTFDKPRHHL